MSAEVRYLRLLLARPTHVFVSASFVFRRRDGALLSRFALGQSGNLRSLPVRARRELGLSSAGIRLLSTLLLGADGALGLLLASWVVNFCYFFPNDPVRSFVGGIIATAAPYAVYRLARETYGLKASLSNLTAGRLVILIVAYAIAGSLLHNIWFYLQGDAQNITSRFLAMFVGDLAGTVIVIYTLKVLLHFLPVPRGPNGRSRPDH
jgi:hypothetical protein